MPNFTDTLLSIHKHKQMPKDVPCYHSPNRKSLARDSKYHIYTIKKIDFFSKKKLISKKRGLQKV